MVWAIRTGGQSRGAGQSTETSCERSPGLHGGRMYEGHRTSRVGQGMVEVKLLCYMWLSPFLELVFDFVTCTFMLHTQRGCLNSSSLCAFAEFRKASLLWLSVCPTGITGLPLEGFPWKFDAWLFFSKSREVTWNLILNIYVYFFPKSVGED